MEITEQDKVKILLTLLERKHDAVEAIRERVYNISIWTLGIFLGAAGLIVQGNIQLSWAAKAFLGIGVVFALTAILLYIRDLQKGFRSQFRVAVQVEQLLGLGKEGFFGVKEALYPSEWAQAGTKQSKGHFFRNTYLLLCLGTVVLLAAIGLSGLVF